MSDEKPEFVDVDGVPIAVRRRAGTAPGLMWLGGYRSDMIGTKAVALDAFAAETGRACTRLDYSGHGESGGAFADGTISHWLGEAMAVLDACTTGPQVLIGSSMGGWIALRMVQELVRRGETARLAGIVLLAPAPDFTMELMEPELSDEHRRQFEEQGYMEEPSEYSPEPNIYTRALFDDGRKNRIMDGIVHTHCPVHILQGMADPDVPYTHALKLIEHLPADDVTLTLVKDGDHRLSRPQDIELLIRTVKEAVRVADTTA